MEGPILIVPFGFQTTDNAPVTAVSSGVLVPAFDHQCVHVFSLNVLIGSWQCLHNIPTKTIHQPHIWGFLGNSIVIKCMGWIWVGTW